MTARELAELMIGLGAVDAMSFDGGGSVGLYVGDQVVMRGNSHDGTPENRALANALAVFAVPKEVK